MTAVTDRQAWMGTLARAPVEVLEDAWNRIDKKPVYHVLRAPETGLVMVRARAGGTGIPFHAGEATVTRCAVQIHDGPIGHAYVMGRGKRQAELAALFDALLQDARWRNRVMDEVVSPVQKILQEMKGLDLKKTAATRVEFFTMVRGD
jgi:alpha-D-ribose 1-methylphosphonate 5-triphosphate synthase subunit PhnG